jgi:hypothetical protein
VPGKRPVTGPTRLWSAVLLACIPAFDPAFAQTPFTAPGGNPLLNGSDMAVLEDQENRKDLPCEVNPDKPDLGFDFRYHVKYDISVPLKEVSGTGNQLTILFRVSPKDHPNEATYFSQRIPVPRIEPDSKGEANLNGSFDLGQGNYHVDLIMRDRTERVCSHHWDPEAVLDDRDKQMDLSIPANTAQAVQPDQFLPAPAVPRPPASGASLKILVNFAAQDQASPALFPKDTLGLVTILRRLTRDPKIAKISLVAFNVQEEEVFYRESNVTRIDFPKLGEALRQVQPGKVDLKKLANKHGEVEFLTKLIKQEMSGPDRPDVLVFAGPKVLLDDSVPQEDLDPIANTVDYPVYYLNYNLSPQTIPWRDSIGKAIRAFHGTEFAINRPRDLWQAVTEVLSHVVKSSQGKGVASASSP